MEQPLPNDNSSHNYKEQELPISNSGFSKPQILRTSPIVDQSPQMPNKHKGVIDVVNDGASDTGKAMFIQENFGTDNKGKGIYHHSDQESKKTPASHLFSPDVEIDCSFPSASDNINDLDNHCSESSVEDDEWLPDETVDADDYSALQAHFDLMNIPSDVEATIPWLSHGQNGNETNIESSSLSAEPQIIPGSANHLGKSSAQLKFKAALGNSLHLTADIDVPNHPHLEGIELFSSFPSQGIQPNKKSSHIEVSPVNYLPGVGAAKPRWVFDQSKQNIMLHGSNNISINQSDVMKFHNGGETSDTSGSVKKQASSHNMSHSSVPGSGYIDALKYSGVGQSMPYWLEYPKMKTKEPIFAPHMASGVTFGSLVPPALGEVVGTPWVQGSTRKLANLAPDDSTSVTISPADLDNLLRNFERFKQFDSVEDHSDHHYTRYGFNMQKASKNWTKSIQQEWKILEKDLPETIFVRVYESRMDLMRAVIIGADGTPYHDGLFFFDIYFPIDYPHRPPQVHYHSGGLRLNPNLYNCGKVCLSLLNTWGGNGNEMWVPGVSTMLQVLVSIQGLILNTNPYFNEPGYESYNGSNEGEHMSQRYNEDVFLLSIRTMVYNIRRPPKHFEDFSKGHFFKRAPDILVACKAYTDGAQVGSLVKGRVQDLDVGGKSCSSQFQQSLNQIFFSMLVDNFERIGVSDCQKFLSKQLSSNSSARKQPVEQGEAQLECLVTDDAEDDDIDEIIWAMHSENANVDCLTADDGEELVCGIDS